MAATSISGTLPSSPSAASTSLPALRWDAEFSIENGRAVFLRGDAEYLFEGLPGEDTRSIISLLDGYHTPSDVARLLGIPEPTVKSLVQQLRAHDLAVELAADPGHDLSPEEFSRVCRHYFPLWKERLFSHPLWRELGSGQATRAQFTGWLIESYHFIEGVNDRLALAVGECFDLRVRPLFAHHYTEEYDHSHFFAKALNAMGFDEGAILAARPLPATSAVLNFMRQCARRDSLQYAVCSGFLESTGADRERGRAFYTYLSKHYCPENADVISPLVDHVGLDEAYGHNSMMEQIVERIGHLPFERASAALDAGAMLVETLETWSTDIQRSYNRPFLTLRNNSACYRPSKS